MPPRFILGLDLGKRQDPSALAVLEYRRFPLGLSYRDLIARVFDQLETPEFENLCPLVVDSTGVGEAMVDLLRTGAFPLVPVTITSGQRVTSPGGRLRVPKSHLVAALSLLLEGGRLGIVRRLPLATELLHELRHFEAASAPPAACRMARSAPASTTTS